MNKKRSLWGAHWYTCSVTGTSIRALLLAWMVHRRVPESVRLLNANSRKWNPMQSTQVHGWGIKHLGNCSIDAFGFKSAVIIFKHQGEPLCLCLLVLPVARHLALKQILTGQVIIEQCIPFQLHERLGHIDTNHTISEVQNIPTYGPLRNHCWKLEKHILFTMVLIRVPLLCQIVPRRLFSRLRFHCSRQKFLCFI